MQEFKRNPSPLHTNMYIFLQIPLMWNRKRSQWVEVPAAKPKHLSLIPGRESCLPSDPYRCTMAHTHKHEPLSHNMSKLKPKL